MAIQYKVQIDEAGSKLIRRVFEELSKLGRSMRPVLGRTALFIIREAKRNLRQRVHDWGPSTGKLGKSLTMLLDEMSVTVGSNLVYAAIQQLGGPIRPKGHKYLAIPVLPALRRSGTWPRDIPRESMKFVRRANIRIGSHSWTGPALVRAENEVRVGKNGKSRTTKKAGEVMFALVKHVNITGRVYLEFSNAARAFLFDESRRAYQRVTGAAR